MARLKFVLSHLRDVKVKQGELGAILTLVDREVREPLQEEGREGRGVGRRGEA